MKLSLVAFSTILITITLCILPLLISPALSYYQHVTTFEITDFTSLPYDTQTFTAQGKDFQVDWSFVPEPNAAPYVEFAFYVLYSPSSLGQLLYVDVNANTLSGTEYAHSIFSDIDVYSVRISAVTRGVQSCRIDILQETESIPSSSSGIDLRLVIILVVVVIAVAGILVFLFMRQKRNTRANKRKSSSPPPPPPS